ncbi:MAG: type IX secretion system membrane protein PorP/SprF, partial [Chitinophagia bacterium]|nr:type IX secretion system membrane protein PorP/SprF [Chitinophagia bacterium]
MKKFLSIVSSALVLGSFTAVAQDIHFSQFYENSILRNPGLTGIFSGELKASANFRNQWSAISVPYSTGSASAEWRILVNRQVADYMSFGLAAYSDKAGSIDFKSQGVYPTIAYNKSINQRHSSYLSVGFTGGYINRTVDMNKMIFSSQYVNGYDQTNPSGETAPFKSLNHFDVGAGISFNSAIGTENRANFYLGVSAFHLNRPVEAFNGGN